MQIPKVSSVQHCYLSIFHLLSGVKKLSKKIWGVSQSIRWIKIIKYLSSIIWGKNSQREIREYHSPLG